MDTTHKIFFLRSFIVLTIITNLFPMDEPPKNQLIFVKQRTTYNTNQIYDAMDHNFNTVKDLLCPANMGDASWPTKSSSLDGFKQIWLDRNVDKKEDDFKRFMAVCSASIKLCYTKQDLVESHAFLSDKQTNGNNIEQDCFKKMSLPGFVVRQLTNRPVVCYDSTDICVLLGEQNKAYTATQQLSKIGTPEESGDFVLLDCLSPKERDLISTRFMPSVMTPVINVGDRGNAGRVDATNTIEGTIVYVGGIGARYEKPGSMDCLRLISPLDAQDGDIKLEYKDLHQNVKNSGHSRTIENYFFRPQVYKDRMYPVVENFLFDAEQRGIAQQSEIYAHVVGLGLGNWELFAPDGKYGTLQTQLFLELFQEIIEKNNLQHIKCLDFSWFHDKAPTLVVNLQHETEFKGIQILFSKRNPAAKLPDVHENMLVVALYAWDSMAWQGNEFFINQLSASGDPAAACSTLIATLQNPLINPLMIPMIAKQLISHMGEWKIGNHEDLDESAIIQECQDLALKQIDLAQHRKTKTLQKKEQEEADKKKKESLEKQQKEELDTWLKPLSDSHKKIIALTESFTVTSKPGDAQIIQNQIIAASNELAKLTATLDDNQRKEITITLNGMAFNLIDNLTKDPKIKELALIKQDLNNKKETVEKTLQEINYQKGYYAEQIDRYSQQLSKIKLKLLPRLTGLTPEELNEKIKKYEEFQANFDSLAQKAECTNADAAHNPFLAGQIAELGSDIVMFLRQQLLPHVGPKQRTTEAPFKLSLNDDDSLAVAEESPENIDKLYRQKDQESLPTLIKELDDILSNLITLQAEHKTLTQKLQASTQITSTVSSEDERRAWSEHTGSLQKKEADILLALKSSEVTFNKLLNKMESIAQDNGMPNVLSHVADKKTELDNFKKQEVQLKTMLPKTPDILDNLHQQIPKPQSPEQKNSTTTNTPKPILLDQDTQPKSSISNNTSWVSPRTVLVGTLGSIAIVGGAAYFFDKIPTFFSNIWNSAPSASSLWNSLTSEISNLWSGNSANTTYV